MTSNHLPLFKEYQSLTNDEKKKIAKRVHIVLFCEFVEKDEHGTEFMDIYFLQEHNDAIQAFSAEQKLEVANMNKDYFFEEVKEWFDGCEEQLSGLLGIAPEELECLTDDNIDDDIKIKIVDHFIKSGDYHSPITCELVSVVQNDPEIKTAYDLKFLDHVFEVWTDDQVSAVWAKIHDNLIG